MILGNNLDREIKGKNLKSRMILQVHDELVFDLWESEEAELRQLVSDAMQSALPLEVELEVQIGTGQNWLEAH